MIAVFEAARCSSPRRFRARRCQSRPRSQSASHPDPLAPSGKPTVDATFTAAVLQMLVRLQRPGCRSRRRSESDAARASAQSRSMSAAVASARKKRVLDQRGPNRPTAESSGSGVIGDWLGALREQFAHHRLLFFQFVDGRVDFAAAEFVDRHALDDLQPSGRCCGRGRSRSSLSQSRSCRRSAHATLCQSPAAVVSTIERTVSMAALAALAALELPRALMMAAPAAARC